MHKYLHIGITQSGEMNFQALSSLMPKIADDWMLYSPNNFIIWTVYDIQFITGALRGMLPEQSSFLILEVNHLAPKGGWLPSQFWDWLNRVRLEGTSLPTMRPNS